MEYGTKIGKKNEYGDDYTLHFQSCYDEKRNFGFMLQLLAFFYENEDRIYPKEKNKLGRTKLFNAIRRLHDDVPIEEIVKGSELPDDYKDISFIFNAEDDLRIQVDENDKISIPGYLKILRIYFSTENKEMYFDAIKILHDGIDNDVSVEDIMERYPNMKCDTMECKYGIPIKSLKRSKNQERLGKWY